VIRQKPTVDFAPAFETLDFERFQAISTDLDRSQRSGDDVIVDFGDVIGGPRQNRRDRVEIASKSIETDVGNVPNSVIRSCCAAHVILRVT
jgi:hypothetical protein